MVADIFRHLQRRTHRCGLSGRRRHLKAQPVERAQAVRIVVVATWV